MDAMVVWRLDCEDNPMCSSLLLSMPISELAVQVELCLFHGKYFYDFPCHKFEFSFNLDNLREF